MLIEVNGRVLDTLKQKGVVDVKMQKKAISDALFEYFELLESDNERDFFDDYRKVKIRKDVKIIPESNDLSVDEWLEAVNKKNN